jgi:squalene cyclase
MKTEDIRVMTEPGIVVHICNPSTGEDEEKRLQVQVQSGLHSEILSQKNKIKIKVGQKSDIQTALKALATKKEGEEKRGRKKRRKKRQEEEETEGGGCHFYTMLMNANVWSEHYFMW